MRIVSLLPSATEIVCALGLREQLVGVSHGCDFPPEIEGLPVVTRPAGGEGVRAATGDELGPAELDAKALLACRPDLIVMQEGGSGPGSRHLEAALIGAEVSPAVVSLNPLSLEGALHSIATIGAMAEAEDDAVELVEALREDLGEIEQQVLARHDQGLRPRRVVILQGLNPLIAGGRWVPEQVRRAGGWDLLGAEGEPSPATTWEAIRDVDPEMLMIAPAGLTLQQAQAQWRGLYRPDFWPELLAVQRKQVFFLEPVYFTRPGPRLIDAVGMLAEIFDPEAFVDTAPVDGWTTLFE